jgi:hypothetical protein
MSRPFPARTIALALIATALPVAASAQMQIKVNDSVSVKLGFLVQMQADFNQNVRQDSSYAQSIFLRRVRLIVGGQVGSHLTFFLDTDSPNLGKTTGGAAKSLQSAVIMQDAFVELKPGTSNALLIDAGLQYVPLCRNCLGNGASLLPIDYGSYSFLQSGPTGSSAGRDVGLLAKGYLADNKVEYRAGVFSGARQATGGVVTSSNSLRAAGRLQVELLEPEAPAYTYAGTYFGRRKVLALGAGIDAQSSYRAYAVDAFLSYPLGDDGVTAQANVIRYAGGELFPATAASAGLPDQTAIEIEAGYHFTEQKLTPFVKYESRAIDEEFRTDPARINAANQDERRFQVGATYYFAGNNLNAKAAFTRGTLDRLVGTTVTEGFYVQNGFTVQLQAFYY